MRYEVAITLILCGTLLAVAPPASDYMVRRQVAQVLIARTDFTRASFDVRPMSSEYRPGCWILGAAMIGIGILGAIRSPARNELPGENNL